MKLSWFALTILVLLLARGVALAAHTVAALYALIQCLALVGILIAALLGIYIWQVYKASDGHQLLDEQGAKFAWFFSLALIAIVTGITFEVQRVHDLQGANHEQQNY